MYIYRISRNIDSNFNLANLVKIDIAKLTVHHYQAIYTTSMGFFPYSIVLKFANLKSC